MRRQRGMHRFVHFMLWGTLLSAGVVLAPGVGAQTRAVVWDTREIPVCWENLPDAPLERQGRQWTREAVQETWERHSQLRFTGWQACTTQSRGIRIRSADEGPHVKRLGKHLDGMPDGRHARWHGGEFRLSPLGALLR